MTRLPFQRIAVTRPSAAWFKGISRMIFEIYRSTLVELGLEVFDVPIEIFEPPDAARISALLADLREFRPQVACGLTHGLHAMACRMPPGRDGYRPNLFTDVLRIPTLCYWDHAPLDMADQLLQPHPASPAESSPDALQTLRRALAHPLVMHWARDSGQERIMRELGFLLPEGTLHEPPPCLPGFAGVASAREPGAGFIGHFYQAEDPSPEYATLSRETVLEWLGGTRPLWDVLLQRIAEMDGAQRQALALDPDQTMFWRYAHGLIVHRSQAAQRLKVLGAAGVPVLCYGDLRPELGAIPPNLVPRPGQIGFGPPLAEALARHEITIDVLNPGFVDGYSFKPLLTFTAGGFMLIDRKRDYLRDYGDAGLAASYDGAGDLAAKVELFLSNPGYQREVGDAMREQITARAQLSDVLRRLLETVAGRAPAARPVAEPQVVVVSDLLPSVRGDAEWEGSRVELRGSEAWIWTSPRAWMYAAAISIPDVRSLREPHLRIRIQVEEGRLGVAPMRDETWDLLPEQLISPSAEPVNVIVELPRTRVSNVLLRNAGEGIGRARVLSAELCDRS